jgi:hypothetical protein
MTDDELRALLAGIEDRLGARSAAIMDRLDRLQDSLTGIRDDIAVNYGATDAARRANDNTREEMRSLAEVQMVMVRQINRMQAELRELRGEP